MPTDYELKEVYRSWFRSNYNQIPNAHAVIIAAHWAQYVLRIQKLGEWAQPTTEPPEPTAPAQPVGEAS